jgi:hypothetical protein
MNDTIENHTYYSHEFWLEFGGSTWWSDIIGLFIIPPIVALGIFLNLLGFLILQFSALFQNSKIYVYLKFTFLNGLLCNGSGMLLPFTVVRRFLPFSNTYFSLWYMNSIALPTANVCYFYMTVLDVFITFEKLTIFIKRLDVLNKKYIDRPHLICMLAFAFCFLVDFSYYFFYVPKAELVYFSPNETYVFYNYEITEFTRSHIGQAIIYIQYALRDVTPLVLLVILNVTLIVELKRYMRNKKNITRRRGASGGLQAMENSIGVTAVAAKLNATAKRSTTSKLSAAAAKARRTNVNASIMVIFICIMTFIKSAIIMISIVVALVETSMVSNLLGSFSDYVLYTCMTLNFFIILHFDSNFKQFFATSILRKKIAPSISGRII